MMRYTIKLAPTTLQLQQIYRYRIIIIRLPAMRRQVTKNDADSKLKQALSNRDARGFCRVVCYK